MKCDNIVIKLSLTLMIKNIIICLCTCALFAGVQVCSCKRRRNVTACAVQYMDNNKNNVSRKASGNTVERCRNNSCGHICAVRDTSACQGAFCKQ